MNKALFLDRDGVLNFGKKGSGYTYLVNDFILLKHSIPVLKKYQNSGYLLIVITNQGGIAKGVYSKEDTENVHKEMRRQFLSYGVKIDDIYFCPHHNNIENCLCRKPKSIMLEKAIARYDIDVSKSIMVGDSSTDVEVAEKVGVKGILIKENDYLSNYI